MSITPSPEALRKQARELAFQLSHVAGTYIVPGWDGYKVAVLLEHLATLAATGTPQVPTLTKGQIDSLRAVLDAATDRMTDVDSATPQSVEAWEHAHGTIDSLAIAALASQGAAPAIAYRGPARFTAEEIAAGNVGIRWVTETHVGGRPTEHDVYQYLAARGADAHCSCEKCAAKRAAPTGAGDAEPYAYAIRIPAEDRIELVHSLDEVTDELTNCECVVTPLYDAPQQPAEAAPGAIPAEVHTALRHAGLVLVRTVHGMEVVPMIQGVAADAALANNKKGGEHAD